MTFKYFILLKLFIHRAWQHCTWWCFRWSKVHSLGKSL